MVLVEDFNIDILREAFLQQRLYIHTPATSPSRNREEGIRAILEYVSRIDACASDAYLSSIRARWELLLRSPRLADLFFLNRYSANRGQPNWYRVNATVVALLEHNIYRRDTYTAVQLHLRMEQSSRRNSHYTGMSRYLLEREEMAALMQIMHQPLDDDD